MLTHIILFVCMPFAHCPWHTCLASLSTATVQLASMTSMGRQRWHEKASTTDQNIDCCNIRLWFAFLPSLPFIHLALFDLVLMATTGKGAWGSFTGHQRFFQRLQLQESDMISPQTWLNWNENQIMKQIECSQDHQCGLNSVVVFNSLTDHQRSTWLWFGILLKVATARSGYIFPSNLMELDWKRIPL